MKELIEIATLRAQGMMRLQAIAAEDGADSLLYRRCRQLWFEREVGADLSVVSGDAKNAITLLQRGLDLLVYGPAALKQDKLPLEDVVKLLGAA